MATVTVTAISFTEDNPDAGLAPATTTPKWKWVLAGQAPQEKSFTQITSAGSALTGPVVFSNVPPGAYDLTVIPLDPQGNEFARLGETVGVSVESGNLITRPTGISPVVS